MDNRMDELAAKALDGPALNADEITSFYHAYNHAHHANEQPDGTMAKVMLLAATHRANRKLAESETDKPK